ncbi:MAG TPA: adenylate/guanylate cyclase domain-containing protein [Candidatus Binatia bacterium]|jgi:TolB-like protein/class 3 adenylate cyclase|nr:adenylate/guanylate cyclase domain-containing protein [Candidatus Binatia bacterium]
MERKLAAILSADVKGYSQLIRADDLATIRTLAAHRELMTALVRQHGGRVAGTQGDNLLAEFPSVVEAVQGAVEMQHALQASNAGLLVERRVEFRMGINLGDIVVDDEQIHGEGVNLAARLEGLAEPGGICLSAVVYEQVKHRLGVHYEYVGERVVKNMAEPVQVWRVVMEVPSPLGGEEQIQSRAREQAANLPLPDGRGSDISVQGRKKSKNRRLGATNLSRAALVVVGLLIAGALLTLLFPSLPPLVTRYSSLVTQPALPLPDKPSIVVLPFINLSEDPKQEYFSDGITEDLTTDLSQLSGLFVIARNSAFTYKGKVVNVQEVSKELGVQYVLEGRVRKAESRVRINAQLIDTATGAHLWAGGTRTVSALPHGQPGGL